MILRSILAVMLLASLVCDITADNSGTNSHLKEIFLGRCWEYRTIKHKNLMNKRTAPCEDLWNTFFQAFSFRSACSVSSYQEFIDDAQQDLPANKSLFWSGTYTIAHRYAQGGKNKITLEDTLTGYLVNSLIWCGSDTDSSGMNLNRCPQWSECSSEGSEAFWGAASSSFAKSSEGVVFLLLDGSRDDRPAYKPQSFFSKYELPNLTHATEIVILVMHAIGAERLETCDSGSILILKADIGRYSIPSRCVDDPKAIIHLLCADAPSSRECRLVKHGRRHGRRIRHRIRRSLGHSLMVNQQPDRFTF